MRIKKFFYILLLCILLALIGILAYKKLQTPSNQRARLTKDQKLSQVLIEDTTVTINNVRDFSWHEDEHNTEAHYVTRTFDVKQLVGVDFYLSTFAFKEKIGHTYLVFTTTNNNDIAVSIEARKETNESYSPLRGLLNQYELYYLFATPEDVTSLRTDIWNEPVYKYSLDITPESAQSLFISIAKTANTLIEQPRFYNTITDNCTSVLWKHANSIHPGRLPWDITLIFTGLSDAYLYKHGLIRGTVSETMLKQESILNPMNKFTTQE